MTRTCRVHGKIIAFPVGKGLYLTELTAVCHKVYPCTIHVGGGCAPLPAEPFAVCLARSEGEFAVVVAPEKALSVRKTRPCAYREEGSVLTAPALTDMKSGQRVGDDSGNTVSVGLVGIGVPDNRTPGVQIAAAEGYAIFQGETALHTLPLHI